jgi:uncharacterized protein (DUF433 family)
VAPAPGKNQPAARISVLLRHVHPRKPQAEYGDDGEAAQALCATFFARHESKGCHAGRAGLIVGMKINSVVEMDPEIMSGTPCFAGTRVPARTLIDYLEGGHTLDDFLEDFPTVSRKQAIAFLEEASKRMLVAA